MNKTNIRINNHFIIEENNEYYASSMKDLDEWKGIEESDLEEYKEENVTKQLSLLMNKYDIYSNVNFFEEDDKKTISVSQKGGWSHPQPNKENHLGLSGGGWGSNKMVHRGGSDKGQGGGDWFISNLFK